MANTITGKIVRIGLPQQVATKDPSKAFNRREIVIDCTRHDPYTGEAGHYNPVLLEFTREGCNDLDNYNPGDVVTISFSLEGYEYKDRNTGEDKIFTKVRPYKIEARSQQQPAPAPQPQPQQPAQQQVYYPQQGQQFPPQQGGGLFDDPPF